MDLHECYAKPLLADFGIPVPHGIVATTADEASRAVETVGPDVMLKIQIPTGRRGKVGGVRRATGPEEAARVFAELRLLQAHGFQVSKILVEERLDIEAEYYVAITMDDVHRKPVLLVSAEGGMDIEEIAREKEGALVSCVVDPFLGLMPYQVRGLASRAGIPAEVRAQFVEVVQSLYRAFRESDATLLEINPLVVTGDGRLVAADAKVTIDSSALYRQEKVQRILADNPADFPEDAFKFKNGFDYLEINPDGDVGIVSTGAGGTMLTLDLIAQHGGKPLNFVDIRTGSLRGNPARVVELLTRITEHQTVRAILVNIFGGVTDMAEFADCFVRGWRIAGTTLPVVVRIEGNNVEAGRAIFEREGFSCATELEGAIGEVVRLARGQSKGRVS